jgi:hypothetical protein
VQQAAEDLLKPMRQHHVMLLLKTSHTCGAQPCWDDMARAYKYRGDLPPKRMLPHRMIETSARDNMSWETPRRGEERTSDSTVDVQSLNAQDSVEELFLDGLTPIMGDWVAYTTESTAPSSVGGPFKASSPYYNNPQGPGFGEGATYITGSPADFMVKSPQDEFYAKYGNVNVPSLFNMNSDDRFLIQPGSLDNGFAYPDLPEPMEDDDDEDDEDEDEDFDSMVVSDDDDLYTPTNDSRSSPAAVVPSSVRRASQGLNDDSDMLMTSPPNEHVELAPESFMAEHASNASSDVMTTSSATNKTRSRKSVVSSSSSNGAMAGRPHQCDALLPDGSVCGKYFSRPYDLVRHHETIHSSARKTFTCDLCGSGSRTFSRMDALSRHLRVKHSAGPTVSLKA